MMLAFWIGFGSGLAAALAALAVLVGLSLRHIARDMPL